MDAVMCAALSSNAKDNSTAGKVELPADVPCCPTTGPCNESEVCHAHIPFWEATVGDGESYATYRERIRKLMAMP